MKTLNRLLLLLFGITFLAGCNEKKGIPGEETLPGDITGRLVASSECKMGKLADELMNTPDTLSCIEFTYFSAEKKLDIRHINTGFNCCPGELSASISVSGDTIIIEESEEEAMCNCNCLFDLDLEINGVEIRSYWLKFVEPYAVDETSLVFEIDLTEETSGDHCVIRRLYPWGVSSW